MYRLRVVPLFLPPLRERRGDVEALLWHFVAEFNRRGPRRVERVAPDAMRALLDHAWPGNVRELRNVVERAMIQAQGRTLHIPAPTSMLVPADEHRPLRLQDILLERTVAGSSCRHGYLPL